MKIETHNLIKKYSDKIALSLPNLVINPTNIFGLVGNNGAGKTTFLRLLLDLIEPTEGYVLSNGKKVNEDESWKAYTGSHLDESFIIDFLTPIEFFRFVGSTYNLSDTEVDKSLELFRYFFNNEILNQNRKKYIRDFSKGNIQKIGIAAAILARPQIVILDEPFANLDPTAQIHLKNILASLKRDNESTIIISSHNINNVVDICSHIAVLEAGEIVKEEKDIKDADKVLKMLEKYFTPEKLF